MSSSYTTFTGTESANSIIVDTIGDDSVIALGGNDTITGSGGNDIVDLGSGNDLITQAGDYAGGTIYGGAGNDTIYSGSEFSGSLLEAGTDNDSIYFGDDVKSAASISGDTGNDSLVLDGKLTSASIYGGGTDVTTTDGNDSLYVSGTVSASFAQGNAGSDTLAFGNVILGSTARGGADNDFVSAAGSLSAGYITGDKGSDTILISDHVKSGSSIFGGSLQDTTGDSADSISIAGGKSITASFVQANAGADTLNFSGAIKSSSIRSGADNDYVSAAGAVSNGYITGDKGNDSLDFEGTIVDTSIWGGSSADTTSDGADYVTFASSTTSAFVQLNAGADTLLASGSLTQSTVWAGADGDSISLSASSQAMIDGQAGNDTLNFAAGTYEQSTIQGGAGKTRFTNSGTVVLSENTSILGGTEGDTLLFTSNMSVTSSEGVIAMGAGADSIAFAAVENGSIFGGASFGDTDSGADTLSASGLLRSVKADLGGGTNFVTLAGGLTASSIYGGSDKDTFEFTGAASYTGRTATQGGNDQITFGTSSSTAAIVVSAGDGNDTITVGNTVANASILGGLGNDKVVFSAAATESLVATKYFYQGGTDSLSFTANAAFGSQTATTLTFYTETGAFASTVTQTAGSDYVQIASGSNILAYIQNTTNTGIVTITEASASAYNGLTSIG